jgi:radical SAM protein with 4Fe4S-binding SPASM domain
MESDLAIRLIGIMKEIGVQTCKIVGGEPTIYKDLFIVLRELKRQNIKSVIITNGLEYSNVDVLKEHFAAGLNTAIISLKSGNAQEYIEHTGKDVYGRVLSSVENLGKFSGGLSFTLTRLNYRNAKSALKDAIKAGIKFINLDFCSPTFINGKPNGDLILGPLDTREVLGGLTDFLDNEKVNYNVQLSLPFCMFDTDFIVKLIERNRLTSGCIVKKRSGLIFGLNGEVGFCNHLMDFPFGRCGQEFTTGAELEKLYEGQRSFFSVASRVPSKKCPKCPVIKWCCGGCPIKWLCCNPLTFINDCDKKLIELENIAKII